MYEEVTYEEIMTRMLDRVRSEHPEIDTREGSLVYTAIAPCALELAIMYTELDRVIDEVFADTASFEYLERRTSERGITLRRASRAVMKGNFNIKVPVGTRFSLSNFTYVVINSENSYLECETPGREPNTIFGTLTPIDNITGLTVAEITECIILGEDDEDVEDLRARYFDSLGVQAYGFNQQQYREVVKSMNGVGAVRVTPVWNGGGTVKLTILNSEYKSPTDDLISIIQEKLDPLDSQGEGIGLAPIGHTVTVTKAEETSIVIETNIVYRDGYNWELVKDSVFAALDKYFIELCKVWETEPIVIRQSHVNNAFLSVTGILDVYGTKVNGVNLSDGSTYELVGGNIPVRGAVNGNS